MRGNSGSNTLPTYPFFLSLFTASDLVTSFWQPTLNGFGRMQLDLARMRTRQAQAIIDWSHEVSRAQPPLELLAANVRLWQQLTEQAAEMMQGVFSAQLLAVETTAEVHNLPLRRHHDRLQLLDVEEEITDDQDWHRRVA